MKYLMTCLFSFLTTIILAQNTKSLVYSNPLIGGNENVFHLVSNANGFLLASAGICIPTEKPCFSIRKYSSQNEVEWETFIDSVGPPAFNCLIANESNIYLATWDRNGGKNKEFINKLDLDGNILKTVEVDNDTILNKENKAIVSLNFIGDSIVVCHNKWLIPAGPDTVFFKFYDKDLNLVKEIKSTENMPRDHVFGLHPTEDGNYLTGKWSTNDYAYLRILKLDTQGNTIWKHEEPIIFPNYWMGPIQDFVIPTKNNSYIFYHYLTEFYPGTGIVPDFPSLQKRCTINDTLIWQYKFFTKNIYWLNYLTKGSAISSDAIIGVGMVNKYISKNKWGENIGWVFKMDQNGKLKWNRYIKDDRYKFDGGAFFTAAELENGDIVVGGELDQLTFKPSDISWVVHLDSSGCITPGCTDSVLYTRTEEINGQPITKEVFFKAYPNPVVNELKLEFYNHIYRTDSEVVLTDASGKAISKTKLSKGDSTALFSMYDQLPGLYYVSYVVQGKVLQTEKVVKE